MKAWMPKKEIAYQTCHLMYNFLWACNILTCEMFIYSFSWRVSKTLILTSGDNDTWIGSRPKSFVLQTSFDVKIKIVTASWTEKSLLVACWSQVSVLFCLLFFFFFKFKVQNSDSGITVFMTAPCMLHYSFHVLMLNILNCFVTTWRQTISELDLK